MYTPGPSYYQNYGSPPPMNREESNYYDYPPTPMKAFYAIRPPPEYIPRLRSNDAQEHCDDILDKMEQTGRVPSKDKFRRMACNVSETTRSYKFSN